MFAGLSMSQKKVAFCDDELTYHPVTHVWHPPYEWSRRCAPGRCSGRIRWRCSWPPRRPRQTARGHRKRMGWSASHSAVGRWMLNQYCSEGMIVLNEMIYCSGEQIRSKVDRATILSKEYEDFVDLVCQVQVHQDLLYASILQLSTCRVCRSTIWKWTIFEFSMLSIKLL